MTEVMALRLIGEAVKSLVFILLDVRASMQHSKVITREIDEFVSTLNNDISLLKSKLPATVSGGSLDSLLDRLKEAIVFVQSRHHHGFFKSRWKAKETNDKLKLLRGNLDSAFQAALITTTLDVVLETNKKIDDFQLKMLEISDAHSSDMTNARKDIHDLHELVTEVLPNISSPVITAEDRHCTISTDGDDDEFYDPITFHLMCDPVKGTDGWTYDRWTIIYNDITQSPFHQSKNKPFSIVCDDINVRKRLFNKFTNAEALFHERRRAYREEALRLAGEGHDGEALVMLENVMKWNDDDSECQRFRELISRRVKQQDVGLEGAESAKLFQPGTGDGSFFYFLSKLRSLIFFCDFSIRPPSESTVISNKLFSRFSSVFSCFH